MWKNLTAGRGTSLAGAVGAAAVLVVVALLAGCGAIPGPKDGALDARYQAIPDGGCVLCWGGPDGDTQIGYSTSGKCTKGEAGVVAMDPQHVLCTGNNLTLDEALGEKVVVGPDAVGAPIIINLNKVLAVHYGTRLEEARKRFIEAGFQGIRNLGYHPIPDWGAWVGKRSPGDMQIPCNAARRVVRELDRKGEGTSWYSGDFDWSDSRCNIYHFSADDYIGPPGDLGRAGP